MFTASAYRLTTSTLFSIHNKPFIEVHFCDHFVKRRFIFIHLTLSYSIITKLFHISLIFIEINRNQLKTNLI